jgi:hypothetical protein
MGTRGREIIGMDVEQLIKLLNPHTGGGPLAGRA